MLEHVEVVLEAVDSLVKSSDVLIIVLLLSSHLLVGSSLRYVFNLLLEHTEEGVELIELSLEVVLLIGVFSILLLELVDDAGKSFELGFETRSVHVVARSCRGCSLFVV